MRTILSCALLAAALLAATGADAQTYKAYRLTVSDSPAARAYALPFTTVKLSITVEREVVRTGPYARFAQKYLGAIAPLADRVTYKIRGAAIDYSDPDTPTQECAVSAPEQAAPHRMMHSDGGEGFPAILPDRLSAVERTSEDMAREAAAAIFAIRKRRMDLLTGEMGDNVYGAGLPYAVEELTRIENEYLSLFLGKNTVTTIVREFDVVPQGDRTTYVVCRFDPAQGLLPDSDLGAEPVTLTIAPEGGVAPLAPTRGSSTAVYRIADFADCRLAFGSDELARRRLPVYQFGVTAQLSVQH